MVYNNVMKHKKKQGKSGVVISNAEGNAVLFDDAQIEKDFAEILQFQRKQANRLLGNFDAGEYVISQAVKEKLLALPKKFDRMEDGMMYCATLLGEFVLNFKVQLTIAADYCTAKLFLIEMEQGIVEDIKHLTLLAEAVEPYMFDFKKEICSRWNIFYEDQIVVKDDVYEYLHQQNEDFLFNRERVELLSQYYLIKMLALLGSMGPLGEKVLQTYERLLAQYMQRNLGAAQNFTLQKLALDEAIRQNNAFAEIIKLEEGAKALMNYTKPMMDIKQHRNPFAVESTTVAEKKESKAKGAPAKVKKKSAPSKPGNVKTYVYSFKDFKGFDIAGRVIDAKVVGQEIAKAAALAAVMNGGGKAVSKTEEVINTKANSANISTPNVASKEVVDIVKLGTKEKKVKVFDIFNVGNSEKAEEILKGVNDKTSKIVQENTGGEINAEELIFGKENVEPSQILEQAGDITNVNEKIFQKQTNPLKNVDIKSPNPQEILEGINTK